MDWHLLFCGSQVMVIHEKEGYCNSLTSQPRNPNYNILPLQSSNRVPWFCSYFFSFLYIIFSLKKTKKQNTKTLVFFLISNPQYTTISSMIFSFCFCFPNIFTLPRSVFLRRNFYDSSWLNSGLTPHFGQRFADFYKLKAVICTYESYDYHYAPFLKATLRMQTKIQCIWMINQCDLQWMTEIRVII